MKRNLKGRGDPAKHTTKKKKSGGVERIMTRNSLPDLGEPMGAPGEKGSGGALKTARVRGRSRTRLVGLSLGGVLGRRLQNGGISL